MEWPPTIGGKVDEIIASNRDDVALLDENGVSLTYGAMDERIDAIAASLKNHLPKSDGRQPVVGVLLSPSSDFICSLLAIWRLGAIYVPLDLAAGTARLRAIIQETHPVVLFTDQHTWKKVAEVDESGNIVTINVSGIQAVSPNDIPARITPTADSTAYILFTSGSTGKPKGIVVQHAGIRAYLEGSHRTWNVAAQAGVVLQQAALSFDMSIIQIFAALCTSGCLLIASADTRGDPLEIANLMVKHGVTYTMATPSEYDMWFRFAGQTLNQCKEWKAAWYGGEPAAPSFLADFRDLSRYISGIRLFNSYGTTETSISGIEGEVDLENPALQVPIPGHSLPNYGCYIVDDDLNLQPLGVPGEILFAGLGIAGNHYLDRPDLTSKAFLKDHLTRDSRESWTRIYRTGDRGRMDEQGNITVLGRILGDTQIKLRGFRIELTEVEKIIMEEASGALRNTIVTLNQDDDERGQFLLAYVVFNDAVNISDEISNKITNNLMGRLRLQLPPYMCPAAVIPVDSLPLTSHGKIDRKMVQQLPRPRAKSSAALELNNMTLTEQRLLQLWQKLLPPWGSAFQVHRGTDFFRSGGHSLLLVKLQALIREEFNDAPRLSQLMNNSELGAMAELLDANLNEVDWDAEMSVQLGEISQLPGARRKAEDGLVIAITGSTGSLGQRIVQELASDPQVARIICLVRALEGRDLEHLFPFSSHKIQVIEAELPALPADTVLSQADCILHCAADRNFWDGYNALRPINVDAVKALAHISSVTGAPLHVLSSGAVAGYESRDNPLLPRPSPKTGYVSSKWVAERYLDALARCTSLPITSHRPTADPTDDSQNDLKCEAVVARDMISISRRLGCRPEFANMSGTIDLARLEDVAASIARSVISQEISRTDSLAVMEHPGSARVTIEGLAAHTETLLRYDENRDVEELPKRSVLEWVGEAKKTGMFEWFFTAQDIKMEDGEGNRVVTRR